MNSSNTNNPIIEEPNEPPMSGSIFGGFFYSQLRDIQRQTERCFVPLPPMIDTETGLASDAFFNAAWDPRLHHYMLHVAVRVRQIGTFERNVPGHGMKWVTNAYVTNDKQTHVQISAWDQYKEIEHLEVGKVG